MQSQAIDTPNVLSFAGGSNEEQLAFAGAWLDINQDGSRLPAARGSNPDGPFSAAEVQPIRTLIQDAHQCMVCEVVYDPDPTQVGDRPSTSDNLAQLNLTILTSDNPGEELTRTLQHSFDADTARQEVQKRVVGQDSIAVAHSVNPPAVQFIGTEEEARRAKARSVMPTRFAKHGSQPEEIDIEAVALPSQELVFDAVDWKATGEVVDELMVVWNDLPRESRVELYMPSVMNPSMTLEPELVGMPLT